MPVRLTFNFLMMFLFVFQSFAQTSPAPSEEIVKLYNILSHKDKISAIEKYYSASDLAALKNVVNLEKIKVPKISWKDGKYIVDKFEFEVSGASIIFKNEKIDFSRGNLKSAIEKMESLASRKEVSWLFFLVPEAHAITITPVEIGVAVFVVLGLIALNDNVQNHNRKIAELRGRCDEARTLIDQQSHNLDPKKLMELELLVKRKLIDAENADCTKCRSVKDETKNCLNGLLDEIKTKREYVNNSERTPKEVEPQNSQEKKKTSRTTEQ